MDGLKEFQEKMPNGFDSIAVDITGFCNANCKYCPASIRYAPPHAEKHFMSPEQFEAILKKILEYRFYTPSTSFHIYATGEPCLHPQINDMLRLLNQYHIVTTISTNASVVPKFERDALASVSRFLISMPGFSQQSYGHQYVDDADVQAVVDVLKSDFLTCGPRVEKLEQKLCALTGAPYCTTVSNGTAALHIACLAAGIRPGDEVIVTPITFAASANAILYCGGTPIFADIDPETYEIDPKSVEAHITEKTKAVIAVDFTGTPCDYNALRAICRKHQLLLIEDAAHFIGTSYRGTPVGSIADLTTFSFHPVKTITAGEGGAVMSRDPELAQRISMLARHGITRKTDLLRETGNSNWYYEQQMLGYNYRLTDIQCALALSQLDKLDLFAARRRELVRHYDETLGELPEVCIQKEYEGADTMNGRDGLSRSARPAVWISSLPRLIPPP